VSQQDVPVFWQYMQPIVDVLRELGGRVGAEIPECAFRRALEALVTENRIVATSETRWRQYRLNPALGHESNDGRQRVTPRPQRWPTEAFVCWHPNYVGTQRFGQVERDFRITPPTARNPTFRQRISAVWRCVRGFQ
jgi:hypothetical protein